MRPFTLSKPNKGKRMKGGKGGGGGENRFHYGKYNKTASEAPLIILEFSGVRTVRKPGGDKARVRHSRNFSKELGGEGEGKKEDRERENPILPMTLLRGVVRTTARLRREKWLFRKRHKNQ